MKAAHNQIGTYTSLIPSLFTFNAFVCRDGIEAKAGTISAGFSRYMTWKTSDGLSEASKLIPELGNTHQGMLSNPITLLDLILKFIVFEKSKRR